MQRAPLPAVEIGSIALLALAAAAGALLRSGHVVGDGVDQFGTFWFYWWILDCIKELRDPSFTTLMFHPLGKDIFAHTGNNFLDALVAAPVQALIGFPRYQPVFVALLLFGNGLAFRPLARKVAGPGLAAWGATLLWTTNPYVLFECMTGRFTQAMLWFLPPAVLAFLRAGESARAGERPWRHAVVAGMFTALQGYTYWFMGFFMALGFAWLAAVDLWRTRARARLLAAYALAGAVCLALVAPAGLAMARRAAAGEVPGLVGGASGLMSGPGAVANNVSQDLHGYTLLESSGQPMFASLVWGGGALLFLLFGRDRARWAGLALVSLAFAIGPVWPDLFGQRVPMPHYLLAYHLVPFFDRLWFPYRLLSVVFLAVTLGIGTLLARVERARWGWLVLVGVVGLNLAEQHRHLAFPLLHREFEPPSLYRWIGEEEGGLIELPIGLSRVSVAWQVVHQQPTWGGMGENARVLWPAGFDRRMKSGFIKFLRAATRDPETAAGLQYAEQERLSLIEEGFRWVVLDRQLVDSEARRAEAMLGPERVRSEDLVFRATTALIARLGPPVAADGALLAWDLVGGAAVPVGLAVEERELTERSWPAEEAPAYEAHLREIGRIREEGPR